jgi:hypothetical protein
MSLNMKYFVVLLVALNLTACTEERKIDALKDKAASAARDGDKANAMFFCIKKYGAENCDENGNKK